ncbi:MAG: hypothetical protein KAX19_05925, partial [Candidatus Brocadiae bacterium]|nr:hypothetical protein [Candidatus Brocadiia bacterium]
MSDAPRQEDGRRRAPGARSIPDQALTAFGSHAELLLDAWEMLNARRDQSYGPSDHAAALTAAWHRRFDLTGDELVLCARCQAAGLSEREREVAVVLVMGRLQLLESFQQTCRGILDALSAQPREVLPVLKCLKEGAPLQASGLISYDDPDEELTERQIVVDPTIVEYVLNDGTAESDGMAVETERDLYVKLQPLCRALAKRSRVVEWVAAGFPPGASADLFKANRRIHRLAARLRRTLAARPRWGLATWFSPAAASTARAPALIVVALLGKELRYIEADDVLFTGIGLARAVAADPAQVQGNLLLLSQRSSLVANDVIKPCSGSAPLLTGDPGDLRDVEFELTEKSLARLGIDRAFRTTRRTLSPVRK